MGSLRRSARSVGPPPIRPLRHPPRSNQRGYLLAGTDLPDLLLALTQPTRPLLPIRTHHFASIRRCVERVLGPGDLCRVAPVVGDLKRYFSPAELLRGDRDGVASLLL